MTDAGGGAATPNIRLYEIFIGMAVAAVLTALAAPAAVALGYRPPPAAILICFACVLFAYLMGVSGYVWRVVGEREWAGWMICARLTEYKHSYKLPLVNFWVLYRGAAGPRS